MRPIPLLVLCCWVAATSFGTASGAQGDRLAQGVRAHVKHVFVVVQENRSFDSYFGTFPGAENLASEGARTHGLMQRDPIGNQPVAPFRIVEPDVADADHSRAGLLGRVNGGAMDRFVVDEESRRLAAGVTPQNAQRLGLLTMAHEDCDTVPFLWKYASTFVLYDHIFQGMYGPSTPGNIDVIAAQTGQSQAAKHPAETVAPTGIGPGVPVYTDVYPAFGPYHNGEPKQKQVDLSFANVLLELEGGSASQATVDSDDVRQDIAVLAQSGKAPVPWGWYQEGFADDGSGTYPAYVAHHNAVQYFGYMRENPALWAHVHDLTDFFAAVERNALGDRGVYFLKGGYKNPFGWVPASADPNVREAFAGDDDHPAYSDSHLAESLVAKIVNAVARSKYWNDSAIIVTWDDSEGFYDHVAPPQFEQCSDARPCGDGPRVPLMLISPFARTHAIVSDAGDHASVVKFLTMLYDLPPLSSLPDEKAALPQGPRDGNPALTDLTAGFDPARLLGRTRGVPASDATIPDDVVNAFPPKMSCKSLGVTPVRVPGGLDAPPPGFSPRLAAP
jgi:phospholipase C